MKRSTSTEGSGFTLLEVLVSCAVLGIMMLVLFSSVTTGLSIWRDTEDRMSADREARSAFQLMADDLGNAVVPANTNLWPRIGSIGGVNSNSIGFLTLKPPDYQNTNGGDFGDICYVEYEVRPRTNAPSNNILLRRFVGSRETYAAMSAGRLPTNTTNVLQMLATNIIFNTNALKRTAVMGSSQSADVPSLVPNFTPLRLVPSPTGSSFIYTNAAAGQRPDAIQVSIGVADMDALRNPGLLANTNIRLKGGGFYTFTVNLPPL